MKKLKYLSIVLLVSLWYLSCEKNTDPISGFVEDDTSGGPVIRKPNIYIYPSETVKLTVELIFPNGGIILDSYPEYDNGWQIQVEPSGMIDSQYRFLFYEAQVSALPQKTTGWIIKGEGLEIFFRDNLKVLLFTDSEIEDFIAYWIPLLDFEKTYIIYPYYTDELSDIIDIQCSIPADNIIRVLYLIEAYNGTKQIEEPRIPVYKREGFSIVEWGVVYQ